MASRQKRISFAVQLAPVSEIQSNYPRAKVVVSTEKADLVAVQDSGSMGILIMAILATAIVMFSIGPTLGFAASTHSRAYGLLTLVMIGSSLFYFVNLFRWTSRAHYALCLLKGYSPRISSMLVGFGSTLSIFLLGIPIWMAFDFLATQSEPNNEDHRLISWSPAALRFMIPYTLSWLWIFIQFLPIWNREVRHAMIYGRNFLLAFAVWSGCKLVMKVNVDLQKLARNVRAQSAAAHPGPELTAES